MAKYTYVWIEKIMSYFLTHHTAKAPELFSSNFQKFTWQSNT